MVQMTAIAFWHSGIRVLYPEFNVLKVVTFPTLSSLFPHLFLRGRVDVAPWHNIRPGDGAWVHNVNYSKPTRILVICKYKRDHCVREP